MQAAGELDEDSEEDADFDMKSADEDEGEPSDESDAESVDAEMIDEQPKVCTLVFGRTQFALFAPFNP